VEEARARYLEARAALESARSTLQVLGLSRAEMAGTAAGRLARFRLRSPRPGTVQRRDLAVGDTVKSDQTPVHIVDTKQVWIMVDAFERDLPLLREGLELTFRARSLPGERFTGEVDWLSSALDSEQRTLPLRAVVKNPGGLLRQGMFGTASLHTEPDGQTAALLVPVDAVQTLHQRPVVFVRGDEPGAFRAVPVVLGQESDAATEVLSGLEPRARVVVEGAFALKSALTARGRSAAHSH
jgi:cobalt-zinc-cadmium efflux system membrane fusion protein